MCGTEIQNLTCQSILRISFDRSYFNYYIKYFSNSPFSPTEIDLTPYCCYYCWWWWWRQYVKICENIKNLSKDKIEKDKTNFAKVTCWSVWRSVCRAMLALSCNLSIMRIRIRIAIIMSIMRIVRRYKIIYQGQLQCNGGSDSFGILWTGNLCGLRMHDIYVV